MASSIFIGWFGGAKFTYDGSSGSVAANWLPGTDNTYDLGSSSYRWKSAYVGTSVLMGGAMALGTTSTLGIVGQNTTAAAAGAQQISPGLDLVGQGWKTDATAASQEVRWRQEVLPVQGTSAPTSTWKLKTSVNAGAFTEILTATAAAFTSSVSVLTPDGSVGTPSLASSTNQGLGWFKATSNSWVFTYNGDTSSNVLSLGGTGVVVLNGVNLGMSGTSAASGVDVSFSRVAAGIAQLSGGSAPAFAVTGGNAQRVNLSQATTSLTTNSGLGTATATNLIPAGSLVVGVSTRVTTEISGAGGLTSLSIGDGSDADRWGAAIALAAGTTTTLANATITTAPIYAAATSVVLTANAGQFDAGVIRITVHYLSLTAATS